MKASLVFVVACFTYQILLAQAESTERLIEIVDKDSPESAELRAYQELLKRSGNGDIKAMGFVGCEEAFRKSGDIPPQMLEKYLVAATTGGYKKAWWCLSKFYYESGFVNKYIQTLNNCVENGELICQFELGYFLVKGKSRTFTSTVSNKEGLTDPILGIENLKKAAKLGFHDADFELALSFHFGRVVERDTAQARFYFEKCLKSPYFDQHDYVNRILSEY